MFVETEKILRSGDVTFVEHSIVKEHLEASPSGRIEDNGDIMDPSSKSPIINFHDEDEEDEDGDCTVEKIVKSKNGAQSKPSAVVRNALSSKRWYPHRVRRPYREWWKIHIIGQGKDEQ